MEPAPPDGEAGPQVGLMLQPSTDEAQGPSLHVAEAGQGPLQHDPLEPGSPARPLGGEGGEEEDQVSVVQLEEEESDPGHTHTHTDLPLQQRLDCQGCAPPLLSLYRGVGRVELGAHQLYHFVLREPGLLEERPVVQGYGGLDQARPLQGHQLLVQSCRGRGGGGLGTRLDHYNGPLTQLQQFGQMKDLRETINSILKVESLPSL